MRGTGVGAINACCRWRLQPRPWAVGITAMFAPLPLMSLPLPPFPAVRRDMLRLYMSARPMSSLIGGNSGNHASRPPNSPKTCKPIGDGCGDGGGGGGVVCKSPLAKVLYSSLLSSPGGWGWGAPLAEICMAAELTEPRIRPRIGQQHRRCGADGSTSLSAADAGAQPGRGCGCTGQCSEGSPPSTPSFCTSPCAPLSFPVLPARGARAVRALLLSAGEVCLPSV